MREIKFRAWLSDTDLEYRRNEQMIFSGEYISRQWRLFWDSLRAWNGNVKELMQYTGLKDKNGKEIYEGDVVQFLVDKTAEVGFGQVIGDVESVRCKVGWRGLNIFDQFTDVEGCVLDSDSQLEVIGNIYENPELLK